MVRQVQEEARVWRDRNFPGHTADQQFMGMVEEMGEIAHAKLKREQAIRAYADVPEAKLMGTAAIADGLGDLIIFAMGFADHYDLDLETIVQETWDKVKQRDWVTDPQTGGES